MPSSRSTGQPSIVGGMTEVIPRNDASVGLEKIDPRRESVTTEVSRKLLEFLLAGHFAPGDRLPSERSMAEALGVGRSVVREALKSLTLLGLVEVRQGSGTYLKSTESDLLPQAIEWGLLLGAKRTQDLVEARRYLEVVVAGLAAERRDQTDLDDLRRQLDRMRTAEGDRAAFVAADVAFHLRVAEAARNETLFQIMGSVRSLLRVWIARVMDRPGAQAAATAGEHAPIYEAILAGDSEAARNAMESHMAWAYARLEETIPGEVDELAGADESVTLG